jgi:hypothetical protein
MTFRSVTQPNPSLDRNFIIYRCYSDTRDQPTKATPSRPVQRDTRTWDDDPLNTRDRHAYMPPPLTPPPPKYCALQTLCFLYTLYILYILCFMFLLVFYFLCFSLHPVYRVSQEEWIKFRESVPYVKIYRYNPKHLCPTLNGYGDNGQKKVWSSLGFHALYLPADSLVHARPSVRYHITAYAISNCMPSGW